VPVSRKRNKSRTSNASPRVTHPKTPTIWPNPDDQSLHELANALAGLAAYRSHMHSRRASLAASAAEALVAELAEVALARPQPDLEDELCARLGARLREWADGPFDDHVDPDVFAEAIITAAAAAVREALDEPATGPDGWRAPWQVLAAAARIVPIPLSGTAADAIEHLRDRAGGQVLPKAPDGPTVTGPVLWTRDAYGSRFGITAAFATPDGPDRWYLWDVDACGYRPFTVHSGYVPTAEQALADWQAGVGRHTASDSAFAPVDNPLLLAELMPAEEGLPRPDVVSADQFAEYHRGRRLARTAIEAVGPSERVGRRRHAAPKADLDAATAAAQFASRLRAQPAGRPQPADLDELARELADSWSIDGPAALYATCSPHRVAAVVLHMRNYYSDDDAAQLIALLPEWVSWLADRNGTAQHLVERCRPYALGEPHADVGCDDSRPDYLARVIE
jgi:hypothetical protein